ncbi:uncharacterized protein EHS24_004699 [Apiotrichum porosum]|uniref:Uncharacterized protein n=1 Tax=Apiotrichum porosum TaxID=105984 RepID=A0A427Y5S4_9TREE|nr:uncharacterized protein EHS24_004699 [Apiotrichum porosum]RSH86443.1 hypothetical protein EHS24_004699 [Apiotrichum porosum]
MFTFLLLCIVVVTYAIDFNLFLGVVLAVALFFSLAIRRLWPLLKWLFTEDQVKPTPITPAAAFPQPTYGPGPDEDWDLPILPSSTTTTAVSTPVLDDTPTPTSVPVIDASTMFRRDFELPTLEMRKFAATAFAIPTPAFESESEFYADVSTDEHDISDSLSISTVSTLPADFGADYKLPDSVYHCSDLRCKRCHPFEVFSILKPKRSFEASKEPQNRHAPRKAVGFSDISIVYHFDAARTPKLANTVTPLPGVLKPEALILKPIRKHRSPITVLMEAKGRAQRRKRNARNADEAVLAAWDQYCDMMQEFCDWFLDAGGAAW